MACESDIEPETGVQGDGNDSGAMMCNVDAERKRVYCSIGAAGSVNVAGLFFFWVEIALC